MERKAGLSKEVCGGMVKLEQSKYVISRRDQNTDLIHMSQQRVRERNLLKCGQNGLRHQGNSACLSYRSSSLRSRNSALSL